MATDTSADRVLEPADPETLARLEADSTADMTRLRDSAERWRNGIAMITGIVSAVLVFKGPDPVAGLAPWPRSALFAVVALAIVAGMVGCYCAIRAAAGLPALRLRQTTIDALIIEQRDRRERVIRLQRRAIGFSAAMIVLLMVSVGLAWFLPRTETGTKTARIQLTDGRVFCGQLLRLDNREVAITVFGESVVVPRSDVRALGESQSCA